MNEASPSVLDLTGRRYLVTGASSGIGAAVANTLIQHGAEVIASGRETHRLKELQQLCGAPERCLCTPFDLSENADIRTWLRSLIERHGMLDGLVHAAGVQTTRPLRMIKDAELMQQLELNLVASIQLTREFRRCGGRSSDDRSLVFLTSVAAHAGLPTNSAYSASKAGLTGFARSAAVELAADGYRVNCIAPGMVHTPMFQSFSKVFSAAQLAQIEKRHPLGFGQPQDVAHAALYLLSPMARWVTGTTLHVDGGYCAL